MSIVDNLRRIRERIARAAQSSGRTADEITLVAVTKYVGVAEAAELLAAGCQDLAESRPQELWSKADELTVVSGTRVRWHLVGHLQRNKVRPTLPLVHLIHSVDSERLLEAIDNEWQIIAASQNQPLEPMRVLLEVNTSRESAKHGLTPDGVEPLLAAAPRFPRVAICGLMTMAALEGGLAVAAGNFAALRTLRDRLRTAAPDCVRLDELSLGMSGDFEVAIREGATLVRIGTALWE
jgi:pyridoxal phosphate enzyme (YggS family)